MFWLDRLIAGMLVPLAFWVLASGLDDLFLDLCAIWFRVARWRRGRRGGVGSDGVPAGASLPEKSIALLIPVWREDGVIEQMLERNIAAIRYSNYEIFVGVYPNDVPTLSRVLAIEKAHPRVHHVVCGHDGPTSKGDCLNCIYRGVLRYEETRGSCFEVFLQHDAEDLIHCDSLAWINQYCDRYDMVQVPVLPLPTPWWEFTHGTYCDEFAQTHLKELHVRVALGGFLPSAGVGTAYRRRALDRLAWNNGDQLFDPVSLTEDYRMGLELHRLGCSQVLLDPIGLGGTATREYFPRQLRSAVRQKARWVAGIALQSWQEFGWRAGAGQLYWLWRDRKGLVGNLLTVLANLIFVYGLGRWAWARAAGTSWSLRELVLWPPLWWALLLNCGFIVLRQTSRMCCVRRAYGWRHALISPIRSVWGNLINAAASARAVALLTGARLEHRIPRWLKTGHCYPSQPGAAVEKRRLGEVLVELRLLSASRVELALQDLEPGERLGEGLLRLAAVSEFQLYAALGVQHRLPFEPVEPEFLTPEALDRLPAAVTRRTQVIPIAIKRRQLWVATPEVPGETVVREISRVAGMEARFQLITPSNYRKLVAAALGPG